MANPILCLHGALGSRAHFAPLLELNPNLLTLNFVGHGNAISDAPFRMEAFAEQVLQFLDENQIEQVDIFGYSMGGYVALYLASIHPSRIGKIFTLGTKLVWTPEGAAKEVRMLDADKILAKVPQYAASLQELHGETWRDVLAKTSDMMLHLGNNPLLDEEVFRQIPHLVRVGLGDRDTMVTLDETVAAYRALPNAQLQVLPNTPHPIDKVEMSRLHQAMVDFFGG
jgi:pimeloyl-ACP methyl ester carboxylesterase